MLAIVLDIMELFGPYSRPFVKVFRDDLCFDNICLFSQSKHVQARFNIKSLNPNFRTNDLKRIVSVTSNVSCMFTTAQGLLKLVYMREICEIKLLIWRTYFYSPLHYCKLLTFCEILNSRPRLYCDSFLTRKMNSSRK